MKVLVLHGPNLNLLGSRETHIYGAVTLDGINRNLDVLAKELGAGLTIHQSNDEGDLVAWIQKAAGQYDALVINPGPTPTRASPCATPSRRSAIRPSRCTSPISIGARSSGNPPTSPVWRAGR